MWFFLPLGTTRPRWRVSYATYGLMVVNGVVFLARIGSDDPTAGGFVPAHPSLFAWVASAFIHADIFHLAGNMLFLWLFATLTEDVFGPWTMLGVYFAGHLGATALHTLMGAMFAPSSLAAPVVGASGAIAGIMGLSAVCFLRTKVRVWYLIGWFIYYWRTGVAEIAAPVFIGLWVAWEIVQGMVVTSLQAISGSAGGVAHWAHVGGFAVGLGGALALKLRKRVVRTDVIEGRQGIASSAEAFAQWGELEQMVKQSPQDAAAWYALGRAREASGRFERAGEAYARALALFLEERRLEDAVKAYEGMKEYQPSPSLSDELRFRLGCALEEGGHAKDAFTLFRQLALDAPQSPRTEIALVRAGEIARGLPGYGREAADCYHALLQRFPYGQWRGLAMERLQELGKTAPERQAPAGGGRPGEGSDREPREVDRSGPPEGE